MSLLNKASLIQIPSGYKDGTLYSAKPTNGDGDFTFSRGSNLAATRVNSDGLIEKGRENLLLQSNQFDTTWTKSVSITVTSGQSGYDGTNDAWLLERIDGSARYIQQSVSLNGVNTFSFYAKADNENWAYVGTSSGNAYCYYNLADGSVGNNGSLVVDANAEDIGNDWYRCSMTVNGTFTFVRIYPAVGNGSISGATDASIFIQDAQLEAGLVATDYIETGASTAQAGILEDMPRLDYSGGATCPSCLLEPQRINRFAHSEYAGGFTSGGAITATDNAAISPEGLQNAIKIEKTANSYAYLRTGLSASTGCLSVFAKKGNYRYIGLRNNQISGVHSTFDFDTETFVVVATGQTCTFENYGNGWYRLTAYQPNNEGSAYQGVAIVKANGAELLDSSVSNGSHFFVYGLQNEIASYPTSYIPTYGASVTRGNDGFGLSSLPSFNNNTEFSIYLELTRTAVDTGQIGQHYYFYSVSPTAFNFWLHVDAPTAQIRFRDALSSNATMSTIPFDADETKKIIVKSDGTNFKTFADGTLISTYAMPTAFQVEYFTYVVKTFNLNEFLAFPTALSDDECEQLTTI